MTAHNVCVKKKKNVSPPLTVIMIRLLHVSQTLRDRSVWITRYNRDFGRLKSRWIPRFMFASCLCWKTTVAARSHTDILGSISAPLINITFWLAHVKLSHITYQLSMLLLVYYLNITLMIMNFEFVRILNFFNNMLLWISWSFYGLKYHVDNFPPFGLRTIDTDILESYPRRTCNYFWVKRFLIIILKTSNYNLTTKGKNWKNNI